MRRADLTTLAYEDVRRLWSISQEMVRRAKRELADAPEVETPPPGE